MTGGQVLPVEELGEPPLTPGQTLTLATLATAGRPCATSNTNNAARATVVARSANVLIQYGYAAAVPNSDGPWLMTDGEGRKLIEITPKGRARVSVEHGLPHPEDGLPSVEDGLPDVEDAPDSLADFY